MCLYVHLCIFVLNHICVCSLFTRAPVGPEGLAHGINDPKKILPDDPSRYQHSLPLRSAYADALGSEPE